MTYPANYGFIPHSLSADGDPCDIMVVGPTRVVPGVVIRSRPIGALMMEDEAGLDEKILAVPTDDLHPFYHDISSYRQLPTILIEQRSEEHTSELQSLMRISYAVFCLKKKKLHTNTEQM